MLTEKYKSRRRFSDTDELPDTIEEVEKKFNIIQPTFSIGAQAGKKNLFHDFMFDSNTQPWLMWCNC